MSEDWQPPAYEVLDGQSLARINARVAAARAEFQRSIKMQEAAIKEVNEVLYELLRAAKIVKDKAP